PARARSGAAARVYADVASVGRCRCNAVEPGGGARLSRRVSLLAATPPELALRASDQMIASRRINKMHAFGGAKGSRTPDLLNAILKTFNSLSFLIFPGMPKTACNGHL